MYWSQKNSSEKKTINEWTNKKKIDHNLNGVFEFLNARFSRGM